MALHVYCKIHFHSDSARSRSYQTNRRSSQTGLESRSSSVSSGPTGCSNFKEFLFQHIELALGRGFDDNVGRNPVTPIFEVRFSCHLYMIKIVQIFNLKKVKKINMKQVSTSLYYLSLVS